MRRRKFPNGALEIGDRRVALAQPNLHIARRDRQLNFRLDVASLFRRNFQFRKKLRRFAITSGARLNLGEALQDVDAIGVTPNSLRPNRVRFVDSIKSDVRFSKFFKDFDAGVVRQLFSKRALPSVASLLKTPRRRQRFAKRRRNWRPARSRRLRFAQRFDRVVLSGTANLRKPQEIEPLPRPRHPGDECLAQLDAGHPGEKRLTQNFCRVHDADAVRHHHGCIPEQRMQRRILHAGIDKLRVRCHDIAAQTLRHPVDRRGQCLFFIPCVESDAHDFYS